MPFHQFDAIFEFLRNHPDAGEAEAKARFPELDGEIIREACIREGRVLADNEEKKESE